MPWIILLCLASLPVQAGLVVTGSFTQNGTHNPIKQFYEGENLRLEFKPGPSVPDSFLIYRGGTQTINVVDGARKSYLDLQQKDVEMLGGVLGSLPIKGPGGKPLDKPLSPKEISFEKQEGTHKVGSWTCTRYNVQARGKTQGRLCVVKMSNVGAKPTDFHALGALGRCFGSLSSVLPPQTAFLGAGLDRSLDLGFAVEVIGFDSQGKENSRLIIDSVKKQTIADSTFAAPKGFARSDFTGLINSLLAGKAPLGK